MKLKIFIHVDMVELNEKSTMMIPPRRQLHLEVEVSVARDGGVGVRHVKVDGVVVDDGHAGGQGKAHASNFIAIIRL